MVKFCKSTKSLVGKTAIVTGANSGIGYETALEFAKRDCRVILACRSPEKGTEALDKIKTLTNNPNILLKTIDMGSLDSVRAFAEDILANEERLDILVNNAGAGEFPNKLCTPEKVQLGLVVNYFSHALLTLLLLDLMKKSGPGRIVNVSSRGARISPKLDMNKLDQFYGGGLRLYAKSKLCQIYFTQELAKRLKGSGVTTYSLHPGVVKTEIFRNSPCWGFVAKAYKTPEEGAQTSIYLSLEDGIEELSGRHFEDCKVVGDYSTAKDEKVRGLLWEKTLKVVGWTDTNS